MRASAHRFPASEAVVLCTAVRAGGNVDARVASCGLRQPIKWSANGTGCRNFLPVSCRSAPLSRSPPNPVSEKRIEQNYAAFRRSPPIRPTRRPLRKLIHQRCLPLQPSPGHDSIEGRCAAGARKSSGPAQAPTPREHAGQAAVTAKFATRGSGGTGRHTILRGWRRKAWGFKSPLPHHRSS